MNEPRKSDPSRLVELRAKIDAIDESVHRLLMQRAVVIDELIAVKGTARNGAAFRPGREADMMHRLAERHSGHLPLTAIEHLWREIISTFTALQAPFGVFASGDPAAIIDTARFYFGFTVPLTLLDSAAAVIEAIETGGDDRLGVVAIEGDGGAWWERLSNAHVVARLPFYAIDARPAATPSLVIAPPLSDPVPPEIACYAVAGANPLPAPGDGIDVLASVSSATGASALVAAPLAEEEVSARLGGGLDIRRIGGYAAPLAFPAA
ncbi:chorismate mutase [Jiella endophytica]|uniref:chorismate mutase n=1 Tax=Jiella endophytica TaxID=2558362 RepID=A0A4Y8RRZ8_9HYPH|nr:chorismate mutase [Jiella endophytica]TFF20774.1 chorismate mutase [Jiella endophytica]TFF27075.1 chorismate mutase [Jiella endophytica]